MNMIMDHTRFIEAKSAQLLTGKELVVYFDEGGVKREVFTYFPETVEANLLKLGFTAHHIPRIVREQAA